MDPQMTVDLTRDSEEEAGAREPAAKRARLTSTNLERVAVPGGVLDPLVLDRVEAIVQQCNCVGCDGRGLAANVLKKLPYGCPYAARRRMAKNQRFAVPADRALPGSVEIREPPLCENSSRSKKKIPDDDDDDDNARRRRADGGPEVPGRPAVVSIYGQWELGPPLKYNRVSPMPEEPDSKRQRELWFQQALEILGQQDFKSLAFPHQIGCGLGGGDWPNYDRMIRNFAEAHPETKVLICELTGSIGACYKCGQTGHWGSKCPVKK